MIQVFNQYFKWYKVLSLKSFLLSSFWMILIAFPGYSLQMVLAQQQSTSIPPAPNSGVYSHTSGIKEHLSMALLNQIKPMILKNMGNKSSGGVSIVVGVITPNGTSVTGYGNISKANTTKVNGDSIFDIGSITKTFSSALLADMVKRGLVKINDPVQKFLPSYVKVSQFNGHTITLEDLATHTSGLPDLPARLFDNHTLPTAQIYNYISHASLISEPGVRYSYNNLGMGLLGYILSIKAGMPYEELVKDRILNVLGMESTGIAMNSTHILNPLPDILKSRLAKGHIDGKEVNLAFFPEIIQPAGALYSSANDLLKYLSANMGLIHTKINDVLQDTHLIRHEERTIANSSASASASAQSLLGLYIGLGWTIATNFGTEVIYHAGAIDGYTSLVAFNPTKQIGLVVLCSCDEKEADSPANWISNVLLSLLYHPSL